MGKLLSERDEQRLSRALPFIERMIRGPVSHSGETEVVVSQGQQWYRLTSNLDAGGTAKGRKLTSDFTYDDTVAEETITDKLGMWGLKGENIQCRKIDEDLVAVSRGEEVHRATITSKPSGGSANATITVNSVSVSVTVSGLSDDAKSGDTIDVQYDSPIGWRSLLGGGGDVDGDEITVITDLTINDQGKLEITTRKVVVVSADPEEISDTTLGEEITVLESVGVEAPDLTMSPKTIVVLKDGTATPETIHEGDPCDGG